MSESNLIIGTKPGPSFFSDIPWGIVGGIVIIVLFAIVGIYMYRTYAQPGSHQNPNHEHGQSQDTSSNAVEICLFYATWCPHCKSARKGWDSVKSKYDEHTVNGRVIKFVEYDCSDNTDAQTNQLMDKYQVEGFPTIKILKNGTWYDFQAEPTEDNLNEFITTMA